MSETSDKPKPERFIGLDAHKHYLVSAGMNADKEVVLPLRRVDYYQLDDWIEKNLSSRDAVAVEISTNTWEIYDRIVDRVHSVTVVHPPHLKLIVRDPVMNDKKAALILARELADDRLKGIWVPPQDVRDLRMLIAERERLVRMETIAKNRLHAVLHRHHLPLPEGSQPFHPKHKEWWLSLKVSSTEKVAVQIALATVEFCEEQKKILEKGITESAAKDDRMPLLIQLPGVGVIVAMTVLAAIGDITRFPTPKQLVGYAGLGARIKESGQSRSTGGITKYGRRDLRTAMVRAAHQAIRCSAYWKAQYERLAPRISKGKAWVAIARRMLVAVWHILTEEVADRNADAEKVAQALFGYGYDLGTENRAGQTVVQFTRNQLDRLKLGEDLAQLKWGSRTPKLPPSRLVAEAVS